MIGGYTLTRPSDEDAERLAAFIQVYEIERSGVPDRTAHDLRVLWDREGFSFADDAWVLTIDTGDIVAYACIWPRVAGSPIFEIFVHPDRRAEGLGSALLDLVEERMADSYPAAEEYLTMVVASDERAHGLLESRGYVITTRDRRMRADLAPDGPPVVVPPGVVIRALDVDRDGRSACDLLNDAFVGHSHAVRLGFEQWRKRFFERPDYDPSLCLVAVAADRIVGTLLSYDLGDRGFVDALGVDKEHRGRGIGAALLLSSFFILAAKGQYLVELNVDSQNTTGATRLYERCGMRIEREYHFLARAPVDAPGGGSL